jgi:hypothetical protein
MVAYAPESVENSLLFSEEKLENLIYDQNLVYGRT